MKKLFSSLLAASLLTACGTGTSEATLSRGQAALTGGDSELILTLVNDLGTDLALLDDAAGLDRRAAENILTHRAGADGFFPSEDDDLFETLAELDAVPYVGPSALDRLLALARTLDLPQAELVEGVDFSALEAGLVIWGVNNSSAEYLDDTVGLDARAARNLAANAPYTSIAGMGEQAYVGAWALTQLRFWSTRWRLLKTGAESDTLAGTFDGVSFDEALAAEALRIADGSTFEQLTLFGGLWTTAARNVIAGRPYQNLAEVAAAWGVGGETLKQLKKMAAYGSWPASSSCEVGFSPGTCEPADAYHVAIRAFDNRPAEANWRLTQWFVPTCLDLTDPATIAALNDHAVEAMGWARTRDQFPQMLVLRDPMDTPSAFVSFLDKSIDDLDEVKNDKLAQSDYPDDPDVLGDWNILVGLHGWLRDRVLENGDATWSWRLDISASECSEYAAVMVDTSTGLMLTLHHGPRC
ncbi:MAG: hypothetical protein P1V51_15685 [Deltaproteobacteria bacterium]|nr:hypothetical protein [Deltaproteobacteria bacterium]